MMFFFDLLTGRVRSEELNSWIKPTDPIRVNLRNPRPLFQVNLHRTKYGYFEPMTRMCRCFNELAGLIRPDTGRNAFRVLCHRNPPPNVLTVGTL